MNLPDAIPLVDDRIEKYLKVQHRIWELFGVATLDSFLKMDNETLIEKFRDVQKLNDTAPEKETLAASIDEYSDSLEQEDLNIDYNHIDKNAIANGQSRQEFHEWQCC